MVLYTPTLILLVAVAFVHGFSIPQVDDQHRNTANKTVLILGGGVAGVIAARTFHRHGIRDFIIIEGRDELGGRLRSTSFGGETVELGANWVQGTQTDGGPANPILTLVEKHKVKTQFNDYFGSLSACVAAPVFTYKVNFTIQLPMMKLVLSIFWTLSMHRSTLTVSSLLLLVCHSNIFPVR